jgi:kynurenine 3-monooxygenase
MSAPSGTKITIVGAGLGGALMAVYLGNAGYEVEVFEKRPDPRVVGVSGGRSINLALSVRGLNALSQVSLADDVMRDAIPMTGRMIHDPQGRLSFQPYGRQGEAIYSVSRGDLNMTLVNAAEKNPNVSVHFDYKCADVELDAATVQFEHSVSGERRSVPADLVIGADGIYSAVRNRMQKLDRFDYSIDYLEHGYKELSIPPADDGGFRMERNALHIWPRRSFMTIALPNRDGSYTVTCFWPLEGPGGFADLRTERDVLRYFDEMFPDMVPHMPTLAHDFFANPTSTLATVRCRPWHYQDKVVLLGDAAHAIVPFFGQGMNAAFEDCATLHECLVKGAANRGEALARYQALRKENCDAIADLALTNFIEMRDHTGSPAFRRRKQREKLLHGLFPRYYVPLYSMVSFTCIPYAEAVRRAAAQDRVLARLKIVGIALIILVGIVFMLSILT